MTRVPATRLSRACRVPRRRHSRRVVVASVAHISTVPLRLHHFAACVPLDLDRRKTCNRHTQEELMKSELEKLYEHIDDIEIAMMTTRRPDGHLQSRAMATQRRAEGADLWFVTLDGTAKLSDLEVDPHVCLSYYKDRTRE